MAAVARPLWRKKSAPHAPAAVSVSDNAWSADLSPAEQGALKATLEAALSGKLPLAVAGAAIQRARAAVSR